MDSIVCSLEGRTFQGLLNGLSKKNFEKDITITYEYLIEQLYSGSDLEQAEILAQIKSFEKLLKVASENYWDQATFEEILQSSQLTQQQNRILVTYWMNEREKIHAKIVKANTWNNHLKDFSWRVDMKTSSKNITEINEPVAMLEFKLEGGHKSSSSSSSKVIRCEMNRATVNEVLETLENIQKQIDAISG